MNDFNQNPFNVIQQKADTANVAKTFVANVFSWMFLALTATAVTAYFFAATPSLLALLIGETGLSPLGWIVMLAPIGWLKRLSWAKTYTKFSLRVLRMSSRKPTTG